MTARNWVQLLSIAFITALPSESEADKFMNNGYEYIIISISLACCAVASIFCAVSAIMRCKQRRRIPRKSRKTRAKIQIRFPGSSETPSIHIRSASRFCLHLRDFKTRSWIWPPMKYGERATTVVSSYFAGRRFTGRDMLRQSHPCNSPPTIAICCGSSWVMENYLQSRMCNGKLDLFSARAVDF